MEKVSLLKILILAGSIVITGYFIGDMQRKAREYERAVEVKGLSEREVPADIAIWPLEITLTGNDLPTINQQLESQKSDVIDFFSDLGFTNDELIVGITNIADAKANTYGGNTYTEFRYVAKSEMTLRTNDIGKIKNALDKSLGLVSKGILIGSKNTWRPIEYIFTGLNDLKPEMIEEATKKAKEVAVKFAQDSDSQVGKIKTARQGLFTISDRDPNTPEIKTVRVVTTIEYFLKD